MYIIRRVNSVLENWIFVKLIYDLRNPAQRLPKVQILRAAIARIDQLQKMLYTDEELKNMRKRIDGTSSPYPKVRIFSISYFYKIYVLFSIFKPILSLSYKGILKSILC